MFYSLMMDTTGRTRLTGKHPMPLSRACYLADDDDEDDKGETVPKATFEEEVAKNKRNRLRAQDAEKQLADLKDAGLILTADDRKTFDDLVAAKKNGEDEALRKKGDVDEMLAAAKAESDKIVEAKTAKIDLLSGYLKAEIATNKIAAELGAAGVKSELVAQATALLTSRVSVEISEAGPVVKVSGPDGSPMITDEGTSATVADLVKSWVPKNQHFLPPSGDDGTGAHKGAGGKTVGWSDIKDDDKAKAAYITEHGQSAYLKLADEGQRAERAARDAAAAK